MSGCGHRSSCRYRRSILPTFADYPVGMWKRRSPKSRRDGGQKSNTASGGDNELTHAAESALPPKKAASAERETAQPADEAVEA
jgi:hypothetical protein